MDLMPALIMNQQASFFHTIITGVRGGEPLKHINEQMLSEGVFVVDEDVLKDNFHLFLIKIALLHL
jgi:hypothetical protein